LIWIELVGCYKIQKKKEFQFFSHFSYFVTKVAQNFGGTNGITPTFGGTAPIPPPFDFFGFYLDFCSTFFQKVDLRHFSYFVTKSG
jgi:hypothetical protein